VNTNKTHKSIDSFMNSVMRSIKTMRSHPQINEKEGG